MLAPEFSLTGRATSDLAQFGDELMADVAMPGNLAVRPNAPFVVVEQLAHCAALVGGGARTAVGSVGAGGEKHRVPQAARPHFAINASAPSALGGGMASEAVGKDVGVAILKDCERGKFVPRPHRLGVLIDDLGHDLGAYLNALVDADLIEGNRADGSRCGRRRVGACGGILVQHLCGGAVLR